MTLFSGLINTNGICVSLTVDTIFHQGILPHPITHSKGLSYVLRFSLY